MTWPLQSHNLDRGAGKGSVYSRVCNILTSAITKVEMCQENLQNGSLAFIEMVCCGWWLYYHKLIWRSGTLILVCCPQRKEHSHWVQCREQKFASALPQVQILKSILLVKWTALRVYLIMWENSCSHEKLRYIELS